MRKLLSLMAGILLALTVYTTSADASVYGGVYIGVPPIYVGTGYYPYYRSYYYPRYYYHPYRYNYYRPYYRRHYHHGPYYRRW